MATLSPSYIFNGLKARGLSDAQAYATLGNWKQESELNPGAVNPGEGALGFGQWRLDRRTALEQFAQATGRQAADPEAQMDFYIRELQQHPGGQAFMAAQDIPSANAALKTYIAYGSPSNQGGEGTRLQNALAYQNQGLGSNRPMGPVAAAGGGAGNEAGQTVTGIGPPVPASTGGATVAGGATVPGAPAAPDYSGMRDILAKAYAAKPQNIGDILGAAAQSYKPAAMPALMSTAVEPTPMFQAQPTVLAQPSDQQRQLLALSLARLNSQRLW